MTFMTPRIEQAKKLSLRELGQIQLFELRMIAAELGLLSNEEDTNKYFGWSNNAQRAELVYRHLHKNRLPAWRYDWVQALFEDIPQLHQIVERTRGHGTAFEYIICLEPTPGVFERRYLHRTDFYPAGIRSIINKRLERLSEERESVWIADMPPPAEVAAFVSRKDYVIKEKAVPKVADETCLAVIREHGHWMRAAFSHFPNIVCFVKAPNALVSPKTFAIMLDDRFSWMKEPDFTKIHLRLQAAKNARAARPGGKALWEMGTPKGSLVLDRATFDKYLKLEVGFKEEAAEEEKEEVAQPAPPPATCSCGVELRMSKMFWAAGVGVRCGECEAKADPEYKERTALVASRKVYLEPPTKVRVTKFDPRPGIDDRGAWSSPSWEEDFS